MKKYMLLILFLMATPTVCCALSVPEDLLSYDNGLVYFGEAVSVSGRQQLF